MLSDCPPFYGNDEKEILKRVEVGKYTFNLPQWNKVGEPAKHLIRMMMFYVPAMRISAEQSLEHEWIRRYIGDTSKKLGQHLHLLIESMNNIPVFLSSGRLGQIVLLYSASKLTESVETETYVNAFHALDNKGKGRLDKQDLIDGYMAIIGRGKPSKVDEDELNKQVDALLAAVDQDDSGMIEISEFLAVMMDKKVLLKKERIQKVFSKLHLDNDGSITCAEVETILGSDKDTKRGKYCCLKTQDIHIIKLSKIH